MNEFRKAVLIAAAGLALAPANLSLFAVALSIINIMNFGVSAVDVAFSQRLSRTPTGDEPVARPFSAVSGRSSWRACPGHGAGRGLRLVGAGLVRAGLSGGRPALLMLTLIPGLTILSGAGLSDPVDLRAGARGLCRQCHRRHRDRAGGGRRQCAWRADRRGRGWVIGLHRQSGADGLVQLCRLGIDDADQPAPSARTGGQDRRGPGRDMTLHQQPLVAAPDPVLGREGAGRRPRLNEARGSRPACARF